ncbi:MAG: class II aldolase/adducin family protein [Clostridiales bacterium]|nr:class II aldolase/adducin family protein [Clostridiales bacterium]
MYELQKQEIIKTGIMMDRYELIALSGGNVSARMENGDILITPSGMIYSEMVPDDVLVMDPEGKIIEGNRKPSSDTKALLYIFKHRTDVNSIIHTHQPYATAVGLIQDEFPVMLTTLANATKGAVKVCPFVSAMSIDMGIQTVENLGKTLAVILKNHGVITVGKTLREALFACVYMEEAAKTYLVAKSAGSISMLTPAQIEQAVQIWDYYGQGTEFVPDELVKQRK